MDAYDLLVQHLGNAAASGTAAPSARVEDEAARIKDLPRAEYDAPGVQAHALTWATEKWGKPGAPMQVRPIQALALFVCHLNGGGFLPVGTGHGKELISRLAADAVGARKPLLLIPPDMRAPFAAHTPEYARSFRLPPNVTVMAYSQLSMATSTDALERLRPDVIVCDEAHLLRNDVAARTKRVKRYLKEHPNTVVVVMSGTLTAKSIRDYCLAPGTRVLTDDLRWVPIETVKTGDALIGFDEGLGRGVLKTSVVQGTKTLRRARLRITTTRGVLTCSTDHMWVRCARQGSPVRTAAGARRVTRHWAKAEELCVGDELAYYAEPWQHDTSHEGGYLTGLLDGEGWVSMTNGSGQVGFAQKPGPVLDAYCAGLTRRGFTYSNKTHTKTGVNRVLPNGEAPHMRLLGMLRPIRLMQKARMTWEGKTPWGRNTERARILKIEPLGVGTVIAVQTSTGTFIAEGFLSHNCHLAEWALKHRSPCPRDWKTRESFAAVLDAKPTRTGEGGDRFNAGAANVDWSIYSPLFPEWQDYESSGLVEDPENPEDFVSPRVAEARNRWRDRLRHAPGVVATASSSCDASLYLIERPIETPDTIKSMLAYLEEFWQRPDGEELMDAIAKWRCGRQLSQGFYYRWKWPTEDGKPTDADKEWLRTRAAWHREVRAVVQEGAAHLDSPMLVGRAARLARAGESSPLAGEYALLHALGEWVEHEHRRWGGKDTPPTETVWVDDFLVRDALRWMKEHPTGLVFYAEAAMAEALALAGVTIYGGGTNPEELQGKRGAALSVNSHRQGKNLQKHHEALILSFEPHAGNMEQLLSRTHRAGQQADEVKWWFYGHTEPAKQAILDARSKALYTQTTMGDRQRLCYANWIREDT